MIVLAVSAVLAVVVMTATHLKNSTPFSDTLNLGPSAPPPQVGKKSGDEVPGAPDSPSLAFLERKTRRAGKHRARKDCSLCGTPEILGKEGKTHTHTHTHKQKNTARKIAKG